MKVVIAGSSGLIGTSLVAALRRDGHQVARLVRRPAAGPDEFTWDPAHARVPGVALVGADAVVNLCGAGIGAQRWTGSYKQELRDSRITPTDVLAGAVAATGVPTLINASAVHYYGGGTADRVVTETSPAGTGFLAALCRDWESATAAAGAAGARVVTLRSAVVLARRGGMLQMLLPLYRLGLGGRLGDGRQYLPWISLADEVSAIMFALTEPSIRGPLNLVGPAPVTNAEFNRALGRAVRRPTVFSVPAFALRTVVGEMADEAILRGPRAIPSGLEAAGFAFAHQSVGEALAAALG
ncbi:TIGR01777 family oxidoreductase [Nocardia stercoris]|uniref:TIGR01777 family protein n=1 Tax=Nocardia stercoris TaxID=2483361 RepID=A0A3M2KPY6_9NOCA|nr:TIGR01777 family oxidoreductase [Nocardia stercoris]RMI27722.1 TIGR01777 family protein [Nocardia stercoris]